MTLTLALDKLCRLMSSDLPQTINPLRLARADTTLNGRINIGEMTRLGPLLSQMQGQVDFELKFSQDPDAISYITGQCFTTLVMKCQRCFDPMTVEIETRTRLIVVTSIEAAGEIPDDYEPLLFTGENIALCGLIEEEILLALPIAPLHSSDECNAMTKGHMMADENRVNPFSVLKKIKPGT